MFTTSMAQHIDRINQSLRVSLRYAFDSVSQPVAPPLSRRLATVSFCAAMEFLNGLIYGLIAERRQSGVRHDDLPQPPAPSP